MHKLMMAAAVAIAMGGTPVAAVGADAPEMHHRHHMKAHVPYEADPAVRDGYVMNGNFDWRRRGEQRPWYADGYNDDCVAWTKDAYHYACDPNSRY